MVNRFFRTGSAWGALPFNTQFTNLPAGEGGSTGSSAQTSTRWQDADPSMAPDVNWVNGAPNADAPESIQYSTKMQGPPGLRQVPPGQADKRFLGLTLKQWLVAGIVYAVVTK